MSNSSPAVMRRRSTRQQTASMGSRARAGSSSAGAGGGHREEMDKQEHSDTTSGPAAVDGRRQMKRRAALPASASSCTCQQSHDAEAASMERPQRRRARGSVKISKAANEAHKPHTLAMAVEDVKPAPADVTAILPPSSSPSRRQRSPVSSSDSDSSSKPNHSGGNGCTERRTYSLPVVLGNPIIHAASSRPPLPATRYLASASALPWSIGVNDDAPSGGLAFSFPLNMAVQSTSQAHAQPSHKNASVLLTAPDDALSLAPFLFDHSNGDEPHPLAPAIRKRASSLPAVLPSPDPSLSPVLSDQLQGWLVGTARDSENQQAPPSSTSTSNLSLPSHSNTVFSDSAISFNNTAATSVSSSSRSAPSSPASSQGESSSRHNGTASHLNHSSPFASKRSSDGFTLNIPERLKKRKLSHKIRSFLLLRPPGFPLPGVDGAADIQHILRAPPWLKNATSELGRESRMAPHEWKWADTTSSHYQNWSITTLERNFRKLLKSNMDQEDLEKEERDNLSRLSPIPLTTTFDISDEGDNNIKYLEPALSPIRTRAARKRSRQASAPPNMEADPEKIANDLISPPPHDTAIGKQEGLGGSSYSQAYSAPPPEVLKSQLLAVLRSRLPEGTKAGDAPLRMKKFVVWNAWVRRASVSNSRSRFRRRSTSPEASALVTSSPPRTAASLSSSPVHSYPTHPETEQISIDLEPESPNTRMQKGLESIDNAPFALSSSLGLMMHDETARTAKRFSRAFDDDENDNEQASQAMQSDLSGSEIDGPFMNARSRTEEIYENEVAPISSANSLELHAPSPFHPSNERHESVLASFQYPVESHRYSSDEDYSASNDLDMEHCLREQDRPMSPLRARMEYKVSTATPPSYSADLAGDNYTSLPHHCNTYDQRDLYARHQDGEIEESNIVPFWFDQDSVTFDLEQEEDRNNAETQNQSANQNKVSILTEEAPSPSLSPNNRKQMANATKKDRRTRSGDWEALTREGIFT